MTLINTEVEFVFETGVYRGWVLRQENGELQIKCNSGPECGNLFFIPVEDVIEEWESEETYLKFSYPWSEE